MDHMTVHVTTAILSMASICKEGIQNCDSNTKCANIVVGVECTCQNCFQDDFTTYYDIYEYFNGQHNCNDFSDRNNSIDSFTGSCKNRFIGKVGKCKDINE